MDEGRCPNCGDVGAIGTPCPSAPCRRRDLHHIPSDDAAAAQASPTHELEPLVGTLVGEFLIVRRLGSGGFGRVLLGLQRPLFQLRAAVKILTDHTHDPPQRAATLRLFENEARALARLRHPHIVTMLQYGFTPSGPFIAMEYVPGSRTLGSVLDARRNSAGLRLAVAGPIMDRVMRGLESAHKAGIIHRDLKPDNIMLEQVDGDPWHVKLVDFGLAKMFHESQDTSNLLGTAVYSAPEQLTGRGLGPWTDIHALGLIAAEVLTGELPFSGPPREILQHKLDPTFDALALPGVAPALRGWIRRAAAWAPGDRFASVAEARRAWLEAVAIAQGAEPGAAMSEMPGETESAASPPPRRVARRKLLPVVLLGGLAAAGAIFAAIALSPPPAEPELGVAPAALPVAEEPSPKVPARPDASAATPDAIAVTPAPAPPAIAGPCERAAGRWSFTTTVTQAKNPSTSYGQGHYELTVTPDCHAELAKTGWGKVRFAPAEMQTGSATLQPSDASSPDERRLELHLSGGEAEVDMALVLRFGESLTGSWRHTGASYEASGFEGTLVGQRVPE